MYIIIICTRHCYYGDRRIPGFSYMLCDIIAIHARHMDIRNYKIKGMFAVKASQSFAAIICNLHVKADFGEMTL